VHELHFFVRQNAGNSLWEFALFPNFNSPNFCYAINQRISVNHSHFLEERKNGSEQLVLQNDNNQIAGVDIR